MDNNLNLLGMAKKAGRLEVGEEPVGASARAGKAKVIVLAADAAVNSARRAGHFGEAAKIPVVPTPYTKAQLGGAVGRTSCAMMAITDAGFAASFVGKLATQTPDTYTEVATRLEQRNEKVLQRQREQRQHEKNVERGKKRPWFLTQGQPAKKGEAPAGEKPTGRPAARPAGKPAGTFAAKPAARPAGKPAGTFAAKPAARPAGKPAGTFAAKPAARPAGKPAGTFAGKPAGTPVSKPGGKPMGKPTGKPGGKPGGKPTGRPAPRNPKS